MALPDPRFIETDPDRFFAERDAAFLASLGIDYLTTEEWEAWEAEQRRTEPLRK